MNAIILNDQLLLPKKQNQTLNDALLYEPKDGVYTTSRSYNKYQVLQFDQHIDRLERSVSELGSVKVINRDRLRQMLRQLITKSQLQEVRFRITLSPSESEKIYIALESFNPPTQETFLKGIRCITIPASARENPEVKDTAWMHQRQKHQLPNGIYTGLLLDQEQQILEGMSSNFYAIQNKKLHTANQGILLGTSRKIVLEAAKTIELPLIEQAVKRKVISTSQIAEAFISSSTRSILPVVEIDGFMIGNGIPGLFTRQLKQKYDEWLERNLENL